MTLPAIPDASSVTVEQAAKLARQVEAWAQTTDDIEALEEAQAKVLAIETYLRRRHEAAATEMARATRRLELRIGSLLPERNAGGRGNRSSASGLNRGRATEFRRIADHADDPAVVDAIERGASRAEVLRAAAVAELRQDIEESREEIESWNARFPDFDAQSNAEDVRQLGELNRLCRDIAALPPGPEFVAHHRHLRESDIHDAEAAHRWLDSFITAWRNR